MRWLASIGLAIAVALVVTTSAGACSCVGGDPRDRLSEAEAALVGRVLEAGPLSGGLRSYRLSIDERVKGVLPDSIDVRTDERSSCRVSLQVGQRVGLLLRSRAAPYEIGTCDLIEPAELEAAVRPYPRGAGAGQARVLVAGAFHDAGLAALDARGRLIGWAFGAEGDVVDACPGARHAVLAGDDLAVIRLRDLEVVARHELPGDGTAALRCLDADARRSVAATFSFGSESEAKRLVAVRDGRVSLGIRLAGEVVLGRRSAYAAVHRRDGYRLVAVPHATGRSRVLVAHRGRAAFLALSPDERHIALRDDPSRRASRLVVAATDGTAERTRRDVGGRAPLWLSSRRLALPGTGRRAVVFDAGLRRRASMPSWPTDSAAATDDIVWWIEGGVGVRGRRVSGRGAGPVRAGYLAGARDLDAIDGTGARIDDAALRAPSPSGSAVAATRDCGSRSSD